MQHCSLPSELFNHTPQSGRFGFTSAGAYLFLGIGVMALSCAVKLLKDTLSTIVSILGVLFILYFFAPGLYADLIVMFMQALRWLGSLFAGLSSH